MAFSVTASGRDHGPGLWARTFRLADGTASDPVLTNIRMAGTSRKPGSILVNIATALLLILAIALYVVSINAQWRYVMDVKHNDAISWIEAASLDGGMAVFTLLALGLSRAGQAARIERLFIVACALGSAAMNYEAASTADLKSGLAYTVPPLFLTAVVDRTVSVIRRHYLGDEAASAWSQIGRFVLYALRLLIAPPSTIAGLRRALLKRTPVPAKPAPTSQPAETRGQTLTELPGIGPTSRWPRVAANDSAALPAKPHGNAKPRPRSPRPRSTGKQQALIKLATEKYGLADLPLDEVSRLATSLAAEVDLHPATARRVLIARARELADGGAR